MACTTAGRLPSGLAVSDLKLCIV